MVQVKETNTLPNQKPKRPADGFIVYATKKYAELAEENLGKSMSDINKVTGEQWKALSDEERIEYKGKGQSDFQ